MANNQPGSISIYNSGLTQISTINDGTLIFPFSMYIDSANDIWVLDGNGNTHLYLDNWAPAGSTLTGGSAIGPWGPNVTVWGVASSGGYIEVFQNVGEAVHYGPALLQNYPDSPQAGAETEDSAGQQYVTDIANNVVHIWSSDGFNRIAEFSTTGSGYGIAVDSVHHKIFVAEPVVNLIEVFSAIPAFKKLTTIH